MAYKCKSPGCNFTAPNALAASKHKCQKWLIFIKNTFRKRNNDDKLPAAKCARLDQVEGYPAEDFVPSGPSTMLSHWAATLPCAATEEGLAFPTAEATVDNEKFHNMEDMDSDESEGDEVWGTTPDAFGMFRHFSHLPAHDPETKFNLNSVCDAPGLHVLTNYLEHFDNSVPAYPSILWLTQSIAVGVEENTTSASPSFGPFGTNESQFCLTGWLHCGAQEGVSQERFNNLIDLLCTGG